MVYYVRSSDGRSRYGGRGRGRGDAGGTCYEVRVWGWSCSCKAFAFGAFNADGGRGVGYERFEGDGGEEMLLDAEEGGDGNERSGDGEDWRWGGLMVGEDVPLCKHLFACVLAEHWSVARGMIDEREVGREEMAGWAAGWGG